jgi:hypothetical protein
MGCVREIMAGITISAWLNGSTGKISSILLIKRNRSTSRASLAASEGPAASVGYVGIAISLKAEYGTANAAVFVGIGIWLAASTCTRLPMEKR